MFKFNKEISPIEMEKELDDTEKQKLGERIEDEHKLF